ncbi:MAG: tRNA (cytidine(34)-2'-O)-methyltransferase [Clostridiales bacterium]|nr:tRNA (cytidine(34)-2'-O)-methyltransferase [Clostridiales bacterium]
MLHIVLVEPEIPQNTGNIARTCAVTGASLHLIRPMGFEISEKWVRRAGLDYWDKVSVTEYDSLADFFARHPEAEGHLWLATTKAPHGYTQVTYGPEDWLFFGKETAGLPEDFRLRYFDRCVRIPMLPNVRCLNLSNAAAVLLYEALRQNGFPGLTGEGEMAELEGQTVGQ